MKKTIKLIPAIVMLLVSAILVSTSTYAWFSMNNRVTVTGMTITTKVNNNLLIAPAANTASTNAPAETMPAASAYGTHLVQQVEGRLEPVSSISGHYDSFWYTSTSNVTSSGDAKTDTYVDYDVTGLVGTPANAFNVNYGFNSSNEAVGYVDYVFALQATNTESGTNYINMTQCDLTYAGGATSDKAFRVAVLVQECTDADTALTTATTKTILPVSGAAYFTPTKAVTAANGTFADVTNYRTAANIGSVAAGETKYFKVTVRLWLEGEDTTCNNATYAALTSSWNLDLAFVLADATGGVQDITMGNKAVNAWTVANNATTTGNTTLSGITYYAYTATGTPTTIYGDNAAIGSVEHWYNISGSDVFEITEFVDVVTPAP